MCGLYGLCRRGQENVLVRDEQIQMPANGYVNAKLVCVCYRNDAKRMLSIKEIIDSICVLGQTNVFDVCRAHAYDM